MVDNFNLHWFGMLTIGNIKQVGKLFHELLDGKLYTLVTAHPKILPAHGAHPQTEECHMEVRTNQKLTPEETRGGNAVTVTIRDAYAFLLIHDTYGVHTIGTVLEGERAMYDYTFKNPYIVFEGNRVTIHHRGAGNLLVWTFAVERYTPSNWM